MSTGITREMIALRAARELKDGMYVNLGIGLPGLVSNFIPEGIDVVLHSENGMLGYSRIPEEDQWDVDLVNAGATPVTLVAGASFCDSSISFSVVRGGHIDLAILGAYEVSAKGDIANWMKPVSKGDKLGAPGPGGGMDLVYGAKRIAVVMEHTTVAGKPRIVNKCSYPITGSAAVDIIFTNLAVIKVTPRGLMLMERAPGVSVEEIQAASEANLIVSGDLKEMEL